MPLGYWNWGVTYAVCMCQERLLPEAWNLHWTGAMCPLGRGVIWSHFYPLMRSNTVQGFAPGTVMNLLVNQPLCNNTQDRVGPALWIHRQRMRMPSGQLKRQGALTVLLIKASEGISGDPGYSPLLIITPDSAQVHRATGCTPSAPSSLPLVSRLLAESMMRFA